MFYISKTHKYSIHSALELSGIHVINVYHVCTFFIIHFVRLKEYMIWLVSFNTFSDVLTVFTCAKATGNL